MATFLDPKDARKRSSALGLSVRAINCLNDWFEIDTSLSAEQIAANLRLQLSQGRRLDGKSKEFPLGFPQVGVKTVNELKVFVSKYEFFF